MVEKPLQGGDHEDQQYMAEPIWYLEVNDNNSQKYVMLVNAETGKEIYLM